MIFALGMLYVVLTYIPDMIFGHALRI